MTGEGRRSLNALEQSARDQLRAAIVSEQRASYVAMVVPVGLYLWVLSDPVLLVFGVVIALCTLLRARAVPAVDRGDIEHALVLFMLGKWLVSIALVIVLPIALPIVVVNLIMPIALGSTNLASHRLAPMMGAAVAVAFVVAVLGYTTNIYALDEQVTPWVWQWLCAIVLTVHFVPMSLILWRSNQQQRLTFARAMAANEELRRADVDLRSSRRRLVESADSERLRIERDLHDGAQQRLVAVLVQMRLARRLAGDSGAVDGSVVDDLSVELEAAIDDLRTLAHGIYPPMLEAHGLERALNAVARRDAADVVVEAHGVERYAPDVEAAIYFCCVEAVQNATKHGGEGVAVSIRLAHEDGVLVGSVVDDGPGFDVASVSGSGRGVQNMADRVGAAGGTFEILSASGPGTRVRFAVPTDVVSGEDRDAGPGSEPDAGPECSIVEAFDVAPESVSQPIDVGR